MQELLRESTKKSNQKRPIQTKETAEELPVGWRKRLAPEKTKPYFQNLSAFLKNEYQTRQRIFPKKDAIFKAFQSVDFDAVKVVILGQDPYHGDGQAMGMSFAVPNDLFPKPPSLKNIFKEIQSDLNVTLDPKQSDLSGWAQQGVLLLNAVLTVRAHQAFSHRNQGWELFTDQVIQLLNERTKPVIFLLWGAAAQKKAQWVTKPHHTLLKSAHPSPLSATRGFFGCRHFSKANALLERQGQSPIQWEQVSLS